MQFVCADLLQPPVLTGPQCTCFDVILCNGVLGEGIPCEPATCSRLLRIARALVAPGGCMSLANRFHAGRLNQVEQLRTVAGRTGWECNGAASLFFLRPAAADLTAPL